MKNTLSLYLLLFVPLLSFSQVERRNLSRKELRKERPAYVGVTMGLSSSSLRDFATSPLTYKGKPMYVALSSLRQDRKRESETGLSYSFGNYTNSYNDHSNASAVKTFSAYHSQLYQLSKLSSKDLNITIGGLFNMTGNYRANTALQNNQIGFELVPTLFGSVKVDKDISRTVAKDKKLLFIKYKRKPQVRHLSYRFNIGLLNSSYRNGYVYTGQAGVLNQTSVLDHYEFKLFSGFRMSSAFDYTISLKNKNKIQLSYLWDAYETGGDLDKLEMAHHTFKLSLLFNTNNQ